MQRELRELSKETILVNESVTGAHGASTSPVETTPVKIEAEPKSVQNNHEVWSSALERERDAINVELEALRVGLAGLEKADEESKRRITSREEQSLLLATVQETQEHTLTMLRKEMDVVKADYMLRANLHSGHHLID